MEPAPEEIVRAETLLRSARHTTGLAAHHYFFREDTPDARATYLAALEAEVEAELLYQELTERHPSDA